MGKGGTLLTWPPNPYPFGIPPGDDEFFVDREGPLNRLLLAAESKERKVIRITGARRIGKSSLLQRFRRAISSTKMVVDLDLRDLGIAKQSDSGMAALEVLKELGKKLYRAAKLESFPEEWTGRGDFRTAILLPVLAAAGDRRVVILIDELDVLEDRYPAAIDDVLQAFVLEADLPPFVVCCLGRPLGAPRTTTASHLLKNAETISLGLFEKNALDATLKLAKTYGFSASAARMIAQITGRHPFWLNMANHYLYDKRSLTEDSSPVTPEEILALIEPTLQMYESPIWNAWSQTGPLKSLVGRVVADLTWQEDQKIFTGIADIGQVEKELKLYFTQIDRGYLLDSMKGLTRDHILVREADGYRMQSPILGRWLLHHSKAELRLAGDPQVAEHLARARNLLEAGSRGAALVAVNEALASDPSHTEALMLAADLEASHGHLDLAIAHLTEAQRSQPQTVRLQLVEILERRVQQALDEDEPPSPWYYKLQELMTEGPNRELVSNVVRYYLKRWEKFLSCDIESANKVFEDLANERFPGWGQIAAQHYAALIPLLLRTDMPLTACAAVVGHVFLILLSEPIDPVTPMQPEFARKLLAEFEGDAKTQAKIREHLQQSSDQRPWWTATISAAEAILSRSEPGEPGWLRLSLLEEIVRQVPDSHRHRFEQCIDSHLPRRLAEVLKFDAQESCSAVRLLCKSSVAQHHKIKEQFDSFILGLIDSDDDVVVSFFANGAKVYLVWANYLRPESEFLTAILDQVELIFQRMSNPRGSVPEDKPEWELFIRAEYGLKEWRELLRHRLLRPISRAMALDRNLPPPEVDALASKSAVLGRKQPYDTLVIDHLRKLYQNPRLLNISIPGLPKGMVKFYAAAWNGAPVTLKVYRLSPNERSRGFLTYLWENERRALMNLSTRLSGQALTRFKYAEPISKEYLVVVTEPLPARTLRDYLKQVGRSKMADPQHRQHVWAAIHALVKSVHALHRAHYIHRAIRPECIFVPEVKGIPEFKLGNFEFSIYLHSMADSFPDDERSFDRYTAPEVLARRFQKKNQDPGESFGSDVYSLGLVLFEILVRDLEPSELGQYYSAQDYDEISHEEWLHGLRREVRNALWEQHQTDERLLLQEMLEPSLSYRCPDLEDLVQLTARIAWASTEIERLLSREKPYLTATLVRNQPSSVENFLRPFVRPDELGQDEEDIAKLISQEISGAHIYTNAGNSERPLLIEGQRILFAVAPFKHSFDADSTRSDAVVEIPYLTVATSLDRKEGSPLARLPIDLKIVNLLTAHYDLRSRGEQMRKKGDAWRRLFDLARFKPDRLPDECREFYTILQITAEVEAQLWKEQVVPYQLVEKTVLPDQRHKVVLKRTEDSKNALRTTASSLDRVIARQAARGERFFELTENNSPLAPLQSERVWKLEKIDTTAGIVELSNTRSSWPPPTGFARPQALVGNRAIRQRRREALEHLREDEYLLRSVTEVGTVLQKNPVPKLECDPRLDQDKQRIVRSIIGSSPIHLVQGPPGTGKTTLAAEVIRQTLALNPSARILITSQAHEPLNNLLLRVHKAFETVDRNQRPTEVRLLSSAKMQSNRWTQKTQEVMRFQPAQVAQDHLQHARQWVPPGDSRVDDELLTKWRNWLKTKSKDLPLALEQRIIASANLVYATANDRSMSEVPDHREFDLLIFEEAAKAYPLEVLGPMRLSRRWLLIGDHEQLSAFNIQDFRHSATIATQRQFNLEMGNGAREQRSTSGGLVAESDRLAQGIADFFEYLFKKGINHRPQPFADRLSLQWRMHPGISKLLTEIYYPFLRDGDEAHLRAKLSHGIIHPEEFRKHPVIWIDVPLGERHRAQTVGLADHELTSEESFFGGGFRNAYEARVLHGLMKSLRTSGRGGLRGQLAFLSPYKAQIDRINKIFKGWTASSNPHTGDLRNKAYTVDSFQGRQEKVVVVSLVRNNSHPAGTDAYGFLEGEEGKSRAAVMFSRAEQMLVIIGCSAHFTKQPTFHIAKVFEHAQKHGVVVSAKQFLEQKDYQEMRRHQQQKETRDSLRARSTL